jgi:hypothetical protein
MVYGETEYFQDVMGDGSPVHRMSIGVEPGRVYSPPELLRLTLAGAADLPCPSDLLFRKDQIMALGGFEENFRNDYGMHEDQAFLLKVFLHTKVFVSDRMWDRYRLHQQSMCALGNELVSERYFMAWLEQYLRAHRVMDAEIWRMIAKRRWRKRHPHLAAWRKRLLDVIRS